MKKTSSKKKLVVKVFLFSCIFAILSSLIAFFGVYFSAKLDSDRIVAKKTNITLYDKNQNEIENNSLYRYLPYEEIGTNIINAFVSLEDKRFFKHHGVDYYRTAGAMVKNVSAGYYKEGGSTITQQLAKNTQLSCEKSIVRKIKEMNLARQIENKYSKEEILEMYLNAIYFGSGIYGIDSACKNYFGKSATELDVGECALLAGIVKNPASYSPFNNPDRANERRKLVLKLMREQNYITEGEYDSAVAENLTFAKGLVEDISSPYYTNAVIEASEILGKSVTDLLQNGYKIRTFYDPKKQTMLHSAFESGQFEDINGSGNVASYSALLADNATGGVCASYSNSKISVFDLRRQPASAIKPILVYAPALESRLITTITPVLDEKIDISGYSPANYGGEYVGWTTVEDALKYSINTVAVQILNEIGVETAKMTAKRMGITFHADDNNLAIALGGMTEGSTLIELTSAYMTLANGGKYRKNSFIDSIFDAADNLIYKNQSGFEQVISDDTAYLLTKMLENTAKSGTAKKMSSIPYAIGAKTGTAGLSGSKNNTDAWNISYSTESTLCVWYGDIDYSEAHSVVTTGGGLPTLLATHIHRSLSAPRQKNFSVPEGIIELGIDTYGLKKDKKVYLAGLYAPQKYVKSALFSVENCPSQLSPYFSTDVTDGMDFYLNYLDGIIDIAFHGEAEYGYKLVKQNIISGEITRYDMSGTENQYRYSEQVTESGGYIFSIEIYFEGEMLGTSRPKLLVI